MIRPLLASVIALGVVLLTVLILTYLERKVIGHIQVRLGPMRTGFHGLLQAPADTVKLLTKEDYIPGSVDGVGFRLAPYLIFVPYFMVFAALPVYEKWTAASLRLGLFFIIAVSGLSVLGSLLAGWASNNKYALLGAMRAVAQVVSYELPLVVSVLAVVMVAGTLDIAAIVRGQSPVPYIFLQPVGFLIFFVASLAEMGRSPFDIPHAESEVIAGPSIEYSGMRWSFFQLGEYANVFAVSILVSLVFLSGWRGPLLHGVIWLLIKTYAVILAIMWVRGTYPRFRPDQLMAFAWKYLLPLSLLNLLLTAVIVVMGWPLWTLPIVTLAAAAALTASLGRQRFILYASRS